MSPFRVFRGLAAIALTFSPAIAQAGAVSVQVEGVRNAKGEIYVAICSAQSFNAERCEVASRAPAGQAKPIAFPGVPPGTYAVKVFHDENGNGKLDSDWFGSPTEGVGLSNNAPRTAWKQFDAAAFTVVDGPAKLVVRLSYR